MFQKSSHAKPVDKLTAGRLRTGQLVFFSVSAAAPMSVLAGGVVATLAITGNTGVPLALTGIALALLVFAVGYNAMSRRIQDAGAFAAYLAHGFGPRAGVVGSYVALATYNAMQISLYGLFGYVAHIGFRDNLDINIPWWAWSFIAMALVAWLGIANVNLNAKIVSVLLTLEVVSIVIFDVGAFMNPHGGSIELSSLNPGTLLSPGIGGVLAFAIAAFVGFESSPFYAEEAQKPGQSVGRATYWALGITGVLYIVSSLALIVRAGSENIVALAKDPDSNLPFSFMEVDSGETVATLASVFLLTSVFAGLGSFHNNVARYLYAAGRDGIMPAKLARTAANGAPLFGSLVQSASAFVIVLVFALLQQDPLTHLFAWLAYISAVGFLLLMIATSIAVVRYFSNGTTDATGVTAMQRRIMPSVSVVVLSVITVVTIVNAGAMLGTGETTAIAYVLPGIILVAGIAGYAMAEYLRRTKPATYALIGKHGRDVAQSD